MADEVPLSTAHDYAAQDLYADRGSRGEGGREDEHHADSASNSSSFVSSFRACLARQTCVVVSL